MLPSTFPVGDVGVDDWLGIPKPDILESIDVRVFLENPGVGWQHLPK